MVSLSDWREFYHFISSSLAVSIFQWKLSSSVHQKYVFWSNNILCESRGTLECSVFVPNMHSCHWLDTNSICSEGSALQCIFAIALLLIVSGNGELNLGPMEKCPKCMKR